MTVLLEVRAITGCLAFDVHLDREAAIDQRFEAIVNRGQRDGRHLLLGANENFRGGRMVALFEQHVIDLTALGGEPMAAVADRLFVMFAGFHRG